MSTLRLVKLKRKVWEDFNANVLSRVQLFSGRPKQ